MRFDDRLMTVLDQPASDPHDRAVRWRQLVDLVARAGKQADNPLVENALHLIRSDRSAVDDALRAAAARAVAALPLPFELVALFASDTLAVSAPMLAAARLERDEWAQLLSGCDDETRQFIHTLHPDLPAAAADAVAQPPAGEPQVEPPPPEEPHVEPSRVGERRLGERRIKDHRGGAPDDQASAGEKPPVVEPPVEELAVDEPPVAQPIVEEQAVEEPPSDEQSYEEEPAEEQPFDEQPIDEPIDAAPAIDADLAEPLVEEPVYDELRDEDPDSGAAGDEQPPAAVPPVAPPPVERDEPREPLIGDITSQPVPSISEVVARIERLRQSRTEPPRTFVPEESRGAAPAGAPALFRWECGPSGTIRWVEGAPRGPLIGRSIARSEEGEGVDDEVARAFAMRAPFRDAQLSLPGEGTAAGTWKISGVPAFEPVDGRFAGYRGIALRETGGSYDPARNGHSLLSDPNSLRELVHEIKTPLNAIIGFAEIIDGQLLGPADRHYRSRAAEIVGQARLLLSAIDDLDFAAKLQADRNRPGSGTDLAMLLEQIAAGMRQGASANAPQLELSIETRKRRCALEPALAERLVTRFCTALFGAAADGENLVVHLDNRSGRCALWVRPPPGLDTGDGDTAGAGFGLRLVRGLARIAGGDLTVTRTRISLVLPEL